MSKFFQAREQAELERALREQARGQEANPKVVAGPLPAPPLVDRPVGEGIWRPELEPNLELPGEPADGVEEHLVSLLTPTAFESEQYRVLRHLVEQMHQEVSTQVIAVSSPGVGDGKTMTAINLAGALSQAPEVRVLLVEADLRLPELAAFLGLPATGNKGVVDLVLNPKLPFEAAVLRLPQYNLAVLTAGTPPPASYEILKSSRLTWLFQEAKTGFDYVVVDTPPVIPLPDCRLLQRWVDGFILVVRAHWTSRRRIQESLEVLDPSKILGVVFNADERAGTGYSGYYGGRKRDGAAGGPKGIGDAIRRRSSHRVR